MEMHDDDKKKTQLFKLYTIWYLVNKTGYVLNGKATARFNDKIYENKECNTIYPKMVKTLYILWKYFWVSGLN